MGELHLEIKVDILRRTYKVDANVGAPQVAYRETLGRKAEIDYTHKKQTGGSGQFARIKLVFEPSEPGAGYSFESKVVGGSVPKEFIPGVEKGLEASRETGVLAGFPVIDFKVDADRRRLPRRRLERAGVRNRRPRGVPRRPRQGAVQAARADHEGRGGDAGRLHGRLHRRPEQPSRPDPRHGCPRQRAGHRSHGAAGEHVRLREHAAVDDARAVRPTPCISTTTSRCRRRSRTRSSPSWPADNAIRFDGKEDNHGEGEV